MFVGGCVVAVAYAGYRLGLPRRPRTRTHLGIAVPAVLALYAFTATLRNQQATVGAVLVTALGVVVWCAWDASLASMGVAVACAMIGPATEIGFVSTGVFRYAAESSQLGGVAPWLPGLYLALGAVTSGALRAVTRSSV